MAEIFLKIDNENTVKFNKINAITKFYNGGLKHFKWSICFKTNNNEYYKGFKTKEERDIYFEKLNKFFHAISIDELLKDFD